MKNIFLLLFFTLSSLWGEGIAIDNLSYYKLSQKESRGRFYDLATNFINASSAEEALQYLSKEISEEEKVKFRAAYEHYHKEGLGKIEEGKETVVDCVGWQFGSYNLRKEGALNGTLAMVWKGEKEQPYIAWQPTYGYCELPWQEFMKSEPKEPVLMRVTLKEAYYYNFSFVDERIWLCCKCFHPRLDESLFIYINKEDSAYADLINALKKRGDASAIVRLRYPDEVKDRKQVELVEVVTLSWLSEDQD